LFAQGKGDARGFNRFVRGKVHVFFTAKDAKNQPGALTAISAIFA
jgi:hypothetical protein